jgi:hypothetical protein
MTTKYLTSEIHYHFADDMGNTIKLSAVKNDHKLEASAVIMGGYPVALLLRAIGTAAKLVV